MSEQAKPVAYMHKWPNGKTAFTPTEKPPGGFDGWNAVTTPLYAELDMVPSEEGMRAYQLLNQALEAMEALHSTIEPDEECEDGIVPAKSLRVFVDAHADLLYRRESLAFSGIVATPDDAYPAAARAVALHLSEFCDTSLPFPDMIADAARKAFDALESVRRDGDLLARLESMIRKYADATLELNTGFGSDYIPIELIGTNLRDVLSAILSGRENVHVGAALAPVGDVGIRHGVNCQKISHASIGLLGGYLHDEKDDTPYDVDGVDYCGRCHRVMPENGNV